MCGVTILAFLRPAAVRMSLTPCTCCAGHDTSVCIAVTLLLTCFTADTGASHSPHFKRPYSIRKGEPTVVMHTDSHSNGASQQQDRARGKTGLSAFQSSSVEQQTDKANDSSSRCKAEEGMGSQVSLHQSRRQQQRKEASDSMSKDDIRRALAYVSACYPHARPSRGSLRQVYKFLSHCEQ